MSPDKVGGRTRGCLMVVVQLSFCLALIMALYPVQGFYNTFVDHYGTLLPRSGQTAVTIINQDQYRE